MITIHLKMYIQLSKLWICKLKQQEKHDSQALLYTAVMWRETLGALCLSVNRQQHISQKKIPCPVKQGTQK